MDSVQLCVETDRTDTARVLFESGPCIIRYDIGKYLQRSGPIRFEGGGRHTHCQLSSERVRGKVYRSGFIPRISCQRQSSAVSEMAWHVNTRE